VEPLVDAGPGRVSDGAASLEDLTPTADERDLIARATGGVNPRQSTAGHAGGERTQLRAEVLRWLCLQRTGAAEIAVSGARVVGPLDLSAVRLSTVLRLHDCHFTDPIDMTGARIAETFHITGCVLAGMRADRLAVSGDLVLDGIRNHGVVSLVDASIGGTFSCTGGTFDNPGRIALNARSITVAGAVLFDGGFRVTGSLVLASARIKGTLDLRGAQCENPGGRSIDAEHLQLDGALLCQNGFRARGEVRLSWAHVGAIHATGARLAQPGGVALSAQAIKVANGLFLDASDDADRAAPFTAEGLIMLREAKVGGQIKCTGGSFAPGSGSTKAIEAGLVEAAEVLLDEGFLATGEVVLEGSTITKRLTCNRGRIENKAGVALNLDGVDCLGKVFLGRRFTAQGEVRLVGAKIRDELTCTGGTFDGRHGPGRTALCANGLICDGSVYLNDGFVANGLVDLIAATVKTQLNCTGGTFNGSGGDDPVAVRADGLSCAGSIYFNRGGSGIPFRATGAVRLVGAEVRTQLNCSGGRFDNPGGAALDAGGMSVGANVYLNDGFTANGEVQLAAASVGRELTCQQGTFTAFHARGLKVGSSFVWRPAAAPTTCDLSFGAVGKLDDDLNSWPAGATTLVGFTFDSIAEPRSARERCRWLANSGYAPDVYQQVARIYRQAGQEGEARTVAVARERDRRRRSNLPLLARAWSFFLDHTVRYGYEIQRVLLFVLVLWLAWIYPFHLAQTHHIMQPVGSFNGNPPDANKCTPSYPCFVPAIYSLEILFPVINLRQVAFWLPSGATGWGQLLWVYVWFAILLGWALSIAVAGGIGHLFSQKE
jgi:hypothetical protein